jgi:hypothetical protein
LLQERLLAAIRVCKALLQQVFYNDQDLRKPPSFRAERVKTRNPDGVNLALSGFPAARESRSFREFELKK